MKAKVKVCGITNFDDASRAAHYGASALGFIFHKKSPRYISPSRAKKVIDQLPPFITTVGVFVDLKERAVQDICRFTGIRTLQFHGDETPQYCSRFKGYTLIKAFRVDDVVNFADVKKYKVNAYLFDTYRKDVEGGTGEAFNWSLLEGQKFEKPFILSGGLNKSNVRQAVEQVNPYAIDISSGLEKTPGIKDPRLIREFFDVYNYEG